MGRGIAIGVALGFLLGWLVFGAGGADEPTAVPREDREAAVRTRQARDRPPPAAVSAPEPSATAENGPAAGTEPPRDQAAVDAQVDEFIARAKRAREHRDFKRWHGMLVALVSSLETIARSAVSEEYGEDG